MVSRLRSEADCVRCSAVSSFDTFYDDMTGVACSRAGVSGGFMVAGYSVAGNGGVVFICHWVYSSVSSFY